MQIDIDKGDLILFANLLLQDARTFEQMAADMAQADTLDSRHDHSIATAEQYAKDRRERAAKYIAIVHADDMATLKKLGA